MKRILTFTMLITVIPLILLFSGCGELDEEGVVFGTDTSTDTDTTTDTGVAISGIMIYRESDIQRTGNLGGRAGADALCESSLYKPTGTTRVKAFLSIDASDDLAQFETLFQFSGTKTINSLNLTEMATNWTDLFDSPDPNNIITSMFDAGVLDQTSDQWWSGSYDWGGASDNCSSFFIESNGVSGRYGTANSITGNWIDSMGAADENCDFTRYVLCVAE